MEKKRLKVYRWLLKTTLTQVCVSLVEEGYPQITEETLWEYIALFRWKKDVPHDFKAMKADIRQVTANDFFDYEHWKALTAETFDDMDSLL